MQTCLCQESFILTCASEVSLLRLVETNFCPKAIVVILITFFRSWIQNCVLKEVPQMVCSELDIFLWRLLHGLDPLFNWEVTVMLFQFFPTTRGQGVFADSWQRGFGKQTKNKRRRKSGTGPLLIHPFKFSVRFRYPCFYFYSLCLRDWFTRLSQSCAEAAQERAQNGHIAALRVMAMGCFCCRKGEKQKSGNGGLGCIQSIVKTLLR